MLGQEGGARRKGLGVEAAQGVFRDGRPLPGHDKGLSTVKLNDQHAFLTVAAEGSLQVGDVIEFGISHPCTCLHLYRVIFGVDEAGRVAHAYPTYFG